MCIMRCLQPHLLSAAAQLPGGSDIRCVVWAVRDRAPDAAPGAQPLRCEVYAVTLAVVEDLPAEGGTAAPADLGVKDVQLLRVRPLALWPEALCAWTLLDE